MVMRDETENVVELELLRAQRAQLASRLQAPWWYVAGVAVALAAGSAVPIGSHYLTGGAVWCGLLFIVVFFLMEHALARASGVAVGLGTWHYPSGRAGTIAMVAVMFANSVVEGSLLEHGLLAAAIVVAVLATLAESGCWQAHLRGIRRDLETGRGAV